MVMVVVGVGVVVVVVGGVVLAMVGLCEVPTGIFRVL
jgi:hypothetical protein